MEELAVVAISLLGVPPAEAVRINPTVAGDEATAIDNGFAAGVRLIAEILARKDNGEAMIAVTRKYGDLVAVRLAGVPSGLRFTACMANPQLQTHGHDKYTGLMMERAGARNVAQALAGFQQVTMEDVLKWNPAVIFVQDRDPDVASEIRSGAACQASTP